MSDPSDAKLELERGPSGTLRARLSGAWQLGQTLPGTAELFEPEAPARIEVSAGAIEWDTGLIVFLYQVARRAETTGAELELADLPDDGVAASFRPIADAFFQMAKAAAVRGVLFWS